VGAVVSTALSIAMVACAIKRDCIERFPRGLLTGDAGWKGLIGYAKRIDDCVSATIAAELATARLDRDDLESVPG